MTEKLGRKALFMGVTEKTREESPPGDEERTLLEELSAATHAALSGDYSERIPETGMPDMWREFAASFNRLLEQTEEDRRDCISLFPAFEKSPVPMSVRYESGKVLLSNEMYRSITEANVQDDPVRSGALQMKEIGMIAEAARKDAAVSEDIRLGDPTGSGGDYRITAIPLGAPDQSPHFLLYLEDISNTAYFERSLGELEHQVSALVVRQNQILLENPLPVLISDFSGRLLIANEAFRRVSGVAIPDDGSVRYSDLPLVESKGQNIEDISKFRKIGSAEVTFGFPSGIHVLWQYGVPVTAPDGTEQIVLIFFDVTAQKTREQDLESTVAGLRKEVEALMTRPPAHAPEPHPPYSGEPPAPDKTDEVPRAFPKSPVGEKKKQEAAPDLTHDVVEFQLGGEKYALDINFAREIVEMMPITPIPRSPPYLRGVMNLRGEITNIITINSMLGLSESSGERGRKIIVLSSEATGGENIGIVVDEVHSVIQIRESDVEHLGGGLSGQASGHIKGIIKTAGKGVIDRKTDDEKDLIIWIDMQKLLQDLIPRK
ncbi:chemotaxis signal transduction protein [Methanolinea mesophila]|uniref:chemotaxis protein CheW n=1 Tax=Methanolinea mesophila TaxID=547055 RepID=UPI0031590C66|nr:chemotaxis signal transduction protein [Methanolinea mesophila]